ncbi:cytochrome c [Achromobacter sp. K91]|uniref:Cytochrome c, mono-and diheme variants n=1 Tax=Achromobacter aegrifaciens TaxID=1287736 RepID=A0AAD2J017_ACHAE|nr:MULTISPECIES: cytochrome c [Achromobacter]RIJ00639.1 cytochrome c [Achromobacter sp. K91]CUJ15594.1 Cytochrome c%2C mono-and diheme variants [Achromobacter aegrifaciens]
MTAKTPASPWKSALSAGLLSTILSGPVQAAEPDMEAGRALFVGATPACAICHTLNDAQSSGAIGPKLDEIKPDAARVATAIRNGIGQMPAYTSLSDQEIEVLAAYVAKATGGQP